MTAMFDNVAFVAGIGAAVCALLLSGLRVASTWAGDRQLGGAGQTRLFRSATRTGTIPSGAKHLVWRELLERIVARRDRPGRLPPQARAMILGAIAGAAVLVWTTPLVAVGVGVLVAAAWLLVDRRVRRRQTRLLAALRQLE
jgi:Flp pilus assembly protein TadB